MQDLKALNGFIIATLIDAESGIPFTMRLVRAGDGYGVDHALIHDSDKPKVEFYDARYYFAGETGAELGQFVSRYYLHTLLSDGREPQCGLNLDGGVPAWSICAETFALARAILRQWEKGVAR